MSGPPPTFLLVMFFEMKRELMDNLKSLATKVAGNRGVEVWDVEMFSAGGRQIIRVTIDKPDGVGLDDCEAVSRDLGTYLDVEDLVPAKYHLEVSSPGLTRPLRNADDFRRSIGKLAVATLKEKVQGKNLWRGIIKRFEPEESAVTLESETGEVIFTLEVLRRAHLDIDFKQTAKKGKK